ncbi:MAG TPA: hypothetical protein VMY42_06780 [Thermoguttaceae bacterium]|nr:hypothetical protein [Thermoguttaceae bacterium]
MFTLVWTAEAREAYDELWAKAEKSRAARQAKGRKKSSKAEGLFKQVHKAVMMLRSNPKHPGLQTHKYHSLPHLYKSRASVFTAYVQQNTPAANRIFWCYGPGADEITIMAITPHA